MASKKQQQLSGKAKQYADEQRKKKPMKETDADRQVRENTFRVAAEELRSYIERYESLQSEKSDIAEAMKNVMSEAKGRGYDPKTLKQVIKHRAADPDKLAEQEAVLEMYKSALGM